MSGRAAAQDNTPIAIAVQRINAGELDAADACLKALLARDTRHPVALYLFGFVAFEQQRWGDAETSLRAALGEAPTEPRIVTLLARTLIGTNRPKEAEQLLRSVLDAGAAIDEAAQAQLKHQLGLALKLQHRRGEAIAAMKDAAKRGLADRASALEYAGLAAQTGELDDAIVAYKAQLERNPLDLEIHALLNDLYCVAERRECVGQSYDLALARLPKAAALPVAKGRLFLRMGAPSEAEGAFRVALQIAPADAGALAGLGLALDQLGEKAAARASHAENVVAHPGDGAALEAFGNFLLRHDDPSASVEILQRAARARPESQSAYALLGLAYRACEDPRQEWLNDYARDVQLFDLDPPQGFSSMAVFNAELASYLRALHAHGRQYPSQTLRGGTQTYDGIFYQGHKLVDILLGRINEAIQAYSARLTDRHEHPFASRLSRSFRHAGSWSSCLRDQGYHVNHIHQKGWISSCYYVAVPDVTKDAHARQGWLKFGEPPSEFGFDWGSQKMVQPVPGRLVLFPSYMWHGTLAFHSAQERITIAFDTIPA